ncbi:MAG: anaerobic glycerol-3-phosphate dehydrogenase subunit C [Anaerolineae bacterium]|nr:anaerobic glycerol-3-phosphate dehydrogenase subunit C [Anaerolineae bacterium]
MNKPIWEAQITLEPHGPRPVELTLDNCIKCNVCVTACPVAAVTDLFPGPKYEAPQAGRFRQPKQETPDHSVDYCSGCRVCNMVCPTGVKIAEINARTRETLVNEAKVGPVKRLRNNLLARSELLGQVGQPVAPLANLALNNSISRWLAEKTLGIAAEAPLPRFSSQKFSRWFNSRKNRYLSEKKVVYFRGCATEYYEPRVGKAAVQVLEANGFEVLLPAQNCCGLPLLSNGEFAAARNYHQNNIDKLVGYVKQGYVIVGTSTSCTLTLKEEAPELLDFYSDDARLLAANTFDLHEFLLYLWEAGELKTENLRPIPLQLAYHSPCQYRAHRLGQPSLEIMHLIPELQIVESQAACCGIAGTYGYKTEKYEIAMAVGQPLFAFVQHVNGPAAVCDSETCRWQITHGTGVPTIHPIELLAAAYGLPVEEPLATILN